MKIVDVYIAIGAERKSESITFFIEKYLKNFKEVVDYYEYPPYFGETEFETDDYKKMLSFVLNEGNRSYRFYFENQENTEVPKGMIFVNEDGSVFLGLSVYPEFLAKNESRLKHDFNSSLILSCYEVLPPDNLKEFKALTLI